MARLVVFAGSARKASLNKRLARAAVRRAEAAGAQVRSLDLDDYPMPLYHGDLEAEEGVPENARKVARFLYESDAFLLACPEYNGSITPLLKNTIDWASRPQEGLPRLGAFRGKVAGLLSASPGRLGGLRGLVHVRAILGGIGVLVSPNQLAVPHAGEAFDEAGDLVDAGLAKSLDGVVEGVVHIADRLRASQ